MTSLRSAALASIAALLLSSCSLGPKFESPVINYPGTLAAAEAVNAGKDELANVTPATEWWKAFGDTQLDAYVAQAVRTSNGLAAAKERIMVARAGAEAASASLWPTVDASASRTRTQDSLWGRSEERGGGPRPGGGSNPGNIRRQNNYFAGVEASYEVDIWGRNGRQIEAAEAGILAEESAYRAAILALIADTAGAYFECLGARENLRLIQEEVRNRAEFLKLIRTREESGLASRLDTRRQEVEEAQVRAELPAAESRFLVAQYRLAVLIGEDPRTFTFPERKLADYPRLPLVPAAVPAELIRQRPDVLRTEAALRANAANIGVAMGQMLPSFIIRATAGERSAEFDKWFSSFSDEWSIGGILNIPVFDGGRRAAQLEAERARLRESIASYRDAVSNAILDVNVAIVSAQKSREARTAFYDALAASRDGLRIAGEQYRAGIIDLLDYLDAQRTELLIRQRIIAADQSYVADVVSVYRALGGGWASPITDPVESETRGTAALILEKFPMFALTQPELKAKPHTQPAEPTPADPKPATTP